MRAQTRPVAGWANENPPDSSTETIALAAEVTVLATHAAGRRAGARLLPLTRALTRQTALVGAEVALTASLLDQLPLARSVVVVIPPDASAESCVDSVLRAAAGIIGRRPALTVAVAYPFPAPHGPPRVNATPEAYVAAVTDARRNSLVTAAGNTVLLVQELVPAAASAVVLASHHRATPVRVDGCETAGTHRATSSNGRRHRSSLGMDTIRRLTALARDAAVTTGTTLSLDIALAHRGPVVLRCRPGTP